MLEKPPFLLLILEPGVLFSSHLILQVSLPPSEVLVPVSNFSGARFPFRTPGGPFSSLSVRKDHVFDSNSRTVSSICEPSDPTGYPNPDRSARAVSDFSDARFPFRTPGGLFSSLSVGKAHVFASNSLTGGPIFELSFPTGYCTPEHSAHDGFRFFRCPFPIPNPERAVFEPKCWNRPRSRF